MIGNFNDGAIKMTTMESQLLKWIDDNKLLHLKVIIEKKGRKEIWGRILSFNELQRSLLIYSDDDKKIFNINLNEIEDILPAKD